MHFSLFFFYSSFSLPPIDNVRQCYVFGNSLAIFWQSCPFRRLFMRKDMGLKFFSNYSNSECPSNFGGFMELFKSAYYKKHITACYQRPWWNQIFSGIFRSLSGGGLRIDRTFLSTINTWLWSTRLDCLLFPLSELLHRLIAHLSIAKLNVCSLHIKCVF